MTEQKNFLPLKVNIFFTNFCNYRCDYCFLTENNSLNRLEMTDEIIEKVIFYMKKYKVPLISIYGGDPLLSKKIMYLSESLSKNKNYVVIATNAIDLSLDYLNQLKKNGIKYLQIGVDRISNEKKINYKEDMHIEKVLSSIRNIKSIGMKYGIASCITRENKDEMNELIEFSKKNNAELLKISFYSGENKRFKLLDSEKNIILYKIKEYNIKNNNYIKCSLLTETLNFTSSYPDITIDIKGDILVDNQSLNIGNIMKDDIGEIYTKYLRG